MTIYSGIFNSVRDSNGKGDRLYNAWWFAKYFSTFIGNGVFPNPSTNLQVIAGEKMTVVVKPGNGWIDGYFIHSDSDHVLQLAVADGVLKRIDRIVMRLNHLTRQIEIDVKKGVFASNPISPILQHDTDAHELALADVYINNGATTITQANITDTRLNTTLCGIVHGLVNQVDTTTLFNQYQSWIQQQKLDYESDLASWTADQKLTFEQWMLKEEGDWLDWQDAQNQDFIDWRNIQQADFEDWYASVQDILNGDVAANLAAQIQTVQSDLQQTNNNLAQLEQQVTTHLDENASTTQKGHVQLSSAVDSTSEDLAATPSAVKQAYDKAISAESKASGGAKIITGTYKGDGAYNRTVSLGVTPIFAIIYSIGNATHLITKDEGSVNFGSDKTNTKVVSGGFSMASVGVTGTNISGREYWYIAVY